MEYVCCVDERQNVSFMQGGDLTDTLFDSPGLPETLTSGDVAVLFSVASTLLTNESINNDTVSWGQSFSHTQLFSTAGGHQELYLLNSSKKELLSMQHTLLYS